MNNNLIEKELIEQLVSRIEKLPIGLRTVFKMLYIEQETVREVAEELNIDPYVVRMKRKEALNLLRRSV